MSENTHKRGSDAFFVILLIILYSVTGVYIYKTFFIPGYEEIQEARITVSHLQQEIQKYKKENERIRAQIKALRQNDPAAWEEATRKYLGWVKPGEIIIETEKK
jgi:cell division protein FtsB